MVPRVLHNQKFVNLRVFFFSGLAKALLFLEYDAVSLDDGFEDTYQSHFQMVEIVDV